ncbi:MAG: hypothetical protein NWE94_02265 [Candidatus Bathyarchaeota archaeon]|nr:hypothetical protein [Candidatus Bathyarchaeota archaeon]
MHVRLCSHWDRDIFVASQSTLTITKKKLAERLLTASFTPARTRNDPTGKRIPVEKRANPF